MTPEETRKLTLRVGASMLIAHAQRMRKRGKPGLALALELRALEALERSGLAYEVGIRLAREGGHDEP